MTFAEQFPYHHDGNPACPFNQSPKTKPIYNDRGKLVGWKSLDGPVLLMRCTCGPFEPPSQEPTL